MFYNILLVIELRYSPLRFRFLFVLIIIIDFRFLFFPQFIVLIQQTFIYTCHRVELIFSSMIPLSFRSFCINCTFVV